MPDDYFFVNGSFRCLSNRGGTFGLTLLIASASSVLLRQKIVKKCRDDIAHFLSEENGQIAIYDAVNPIAAGRRSLAKEFAKQNIEVCHLRCVDCLLLTKCRHSL
jgi:hypothetical protein